MATTLCGTCLRTVLRQRNAIPRTLSRAAPSNSIRAISTSIPRFAAVAQPNVSTNSTAQESAQSQHVKQTVSKDDLNKMKSEIQGGTLDTYAAYGATEILYKECAKQAEYTIERGVVGEDGEEVEVETLENGTQIGKGSGWWYEELGLQPTFTTWSHITMLHMYLISARLRCLPTQEITQTWQQHFIDHFFTDAENRMIYSHGLESRMARNGYLKDLFLQWRGILLAYDEGIVKGDAVLAAAIWRNLFNAQEDVDIVKLTQIVAFMRRSLRDLEAMGDLEVVSKSEGERLFGKPTEEAVLVAKRSPLMDLPIEQAPGKPMGKSPAAKKA